MGKILTSGWTSHSFNPLSMFSRSLTVSGISSFWLHRLPLAAIFVAITATTLFRAASLKLKGVRAHSASNSMLQPDSTN